MAYKGYFKPRNPQKYRGDPTNIIYRSRWECILMDRFDKDPNVLWWQSEEFFIPYRSPIDNRIHRYFPDFLIGVKSSNKTTTTLIEVKPYSQTQPPILKEGSSPRSRRYIKEVMDWGVNSAKWAAAREYCADRGYRFSIITEKELGLTF